MCSARNMVLETFVGVVSCQQQYPRMVCHRYYKRPARKTIMAGVAKSCTCIQNHTRPITKQMMEQWHKRLCEVLLRNCSVQQNGRCGEGLKM